MTEIGKKSAKNEIGNKYGKLTILRRAKEEEILISYGYTRD